MVEFQEVVRSSIPSRETELEEVNHDGDGSSQGSRPNRVTPAMGLRVANNQGLGTQNINEGGTQNNVTGGVFINEPTFYGKVQFQSRGKITVLQNISNTNSKT